MLVDDIPFGVGDFLDHVSIGELSAVSDGTVRVGQFLDGNAIFQAAEHAGLGAVVLVLQRRDSQLLSEVPGFVDANDVVKHPKCRDVPGFIQRGPRRHEAFIAAAGVHRDVEAFLIILQNNR
ncbi:hypothetical protein D3C81_1509120 [compost metagenome]